jgi:hypothetical protein
LAFDLWLSHLKCGCAWLGRENKNVMAESHEYFSMQHAIIKAEVSN